MIMLLNAKTDTIVKWLTDNKLETYDILSKVNLPKISEKDEELLRQYQVDFENISDKNKKIIFNNNLLEQLKSIDINSLRSDYQKYPEKIDTSKIIGAIGAWKSELSHEVNMRDKYESLKNSDDAECPTCEQPIDFAFIENKYAEVEEMYNIEPFLFFDIILQTFVVKSKAAIKFIDKTFSRIFLL